MQAELSNGVSVVMGWKLIRNIISNVWSQDNRVESLLLHNKSINSTMSSSTLIVDEGISDSGGNTLNDKEESWHIEVS